MRTFSHAGATCETTKRRITVARSPAGRALGVWIDSQLALRLRDDAEAQVLYILLRDALECEGKLPPALDPRPIANIDAGE